MNADVVVIGSGAAGAVVAAEMQERGRKVVLIEEGPRPKRNEGNVADQVNRYYRNSGALLAIGDPPITVQAGCVVGGSTYVNGGTCFRTPDDVLEDWSARVGKVWRPRDLDEHFAAVERDIHVTRVPDHLIFEGEKRLMAAATARGDRVEIVQRNAKNCQGTGLCPFGCPTGAKQSVDLSYVPRAEKAGCTVLVETKVTRILLDNDRVTGVRCADGREIRAPIVVLAAGAVHSPLILRRSLGERCPRMVGRQLFLHPGAHVAGLVKGQDFVREGPIQSSAIFGDDHDYVIFGMNYPPEIFGVLVTTHDADSSRMLRWRDSVTLAIMGSDHESEGGHVDEVMGEAVLRYQTATSTTNAIQRGIAHAAELLLAIGCDEIFASVRGAGILRSMDDVRAFREKTFKRSAFSLGSVHPMATVPFGDDPETSALDPNLQVHGIRGLYVPDASCFPTSLGVNPQITVMAFARRLALFLSDAPSSAR